MLPVAGFGKSTMIGALTPFGPRISEPGGCSLIDGLAGKVGRTIGRGACLPGETDFWFIGPTITLGGAILGAGTGMYGCLSPPESDVKRAAFLGASEGVKTPVDSPTYLGLSSQPEEPLEDGAAGGCSESLSPKSETDDPVFSEITRGGFAGLGIVGFASILGGGTPVSCWKGASEILGLGIFGGGGPASSGVRKAFSQDPGRGSLSDGAIAAEKLGPGRPGTETLDDDGNVLGWIRSTFSTRSSAT